MPVFWSPRDCADHRQPASSCVIIVSIALSSPTTLNAPSTPSQQLKTLGVLPPAIKLHLAMANAATLMSAGRDEDARQSLAAVASSASVMEPEAMADSKDGSSALILAWWHAAQALVAAHLRDWQVG